MNATDHSVFNRLMEYLSNPDTLVQIRQIPYPELSEIAYQGWEDANDCLWIMSITVMVHGTDIQKNWMTQWASDCDKVWVNDHWEIIDNVRPQE